MTLFSAFVLDTNPTWHKFKWLSLTRLARCYLLSNDTLQGVEYFTTLATWEPRKVARHQLFIMANEDEGVAVTFGEFKRKDRRCKKMFSTFMSSLVPGKAAAMAGFSRWGQRLKANFSIDTHRHG